jgi:hypothetical protein
MLLGTRTLVTAHIAGGAWAMHQAEQEQGAAGHTHTCNNACSRVYVHELQVKANRTQICIEFFNFEYEVAIFNFHKAQKV